MGRIKKSKYAITLPSWFWIVELVLGIAGILLLVFCFMASSFYDAFIK